MCRRQEGFSLSSDWLTASVQCQNDVCLCDSVFSIWTATCASWPSFSRRPACTWCGTELRSCGNAWYLGRMSVNLTVRYGSSYANLTLSLAARCEQFVLDDCSRGMSELTANISLTLCFGLFLEQREQNSAAYIQYIVTRYLTV